MGYTAKQRIAAAKTIPSTAEVCTKQGTPTETSRAATGATSLLTGAFSNFAETRTKPNTLSARPASTAQAAAAR